MYNIYFPDNNINVFLIIFPQYYKYVIGGNLDNSGLSSFLQKNKIILCVANNLIQININKLCN